MLILLIINTILSIGIGFASLGLMMGAGYAGERRGGRSMAATTVAILTFILPGTVAISIIGWWVSFLLGNDGLAIGFMVAPWFNLLVAVGGIILHDSR